MKLSNRRSNHLLACACAAFALHCGESATEGVDKKAIATHSASLVRTSYFDSLQEARKLDTAIDEFLADPSEEGLRAAREAWLAAREPYLQTEVYRFYDGPIDHPEDGPEGMLNAWPLSESYIDYVEEDPEAGIINDLDQEISAETLLALNEQGGETNIATGFHAIEFLLWGQDTDPDGPGDRPYTDYVTDEDEATRPNAERRAEYLKVVSELLVEHLSSLVDAWDAGEDNYRQSFVEDANLSKSMANILTGMVVLSGFETGGERLQTALESGSQEDEHSCFSDNTHRDMIGDVQGLYNVWHGTYESSSLEDTLSGPSIADLVAEAEPELAEEVSRRLDQSRETANALHAPFDREIAADNDAGRERVQELIVALNALEGALRDVFEKMDFEVPQQTAERQE
jgi:putative iron-regulated protein